MNNILLAPFALNLLLFSCNNATQPETKEVTSSIATQAEHNHTEAIALNNGEKREVDAHMLTHIRNMEGDIATFAKQKDNNYDALAKKTSGKY